MTTLLYAYRPTTQDERRMDHWVAAQDDPVSRHRDTDPSRPELARLLTKVRSGSADRLAVCRLDDLGLAAPALAVLLDEFVATGAMMVFVNDPMDPMTADGRRLSLFLAEAADAQRRLQGERQQDGFDRARAAGKKIGGKPVGLRIRLLPEKQRQVEEMNAGGKSAREIAAAVGLSVRTVARHLASLRRSSHE